MEQINIDELVQKFKEKLVETKEVESFRSQVIEPLVEKIFREDFINVFENVADTINQRVGTEVIRHYIDGNKNVIEGPFHTIYFQKSNIEILNDKAYINIIPIYNWKGVTKHMGPISFEVASNTKRAIWDIPFESIDIYAKTLFSGFIEDKDFNI